MFDDLRRRLSSFIHKNTPLPETPPTGEQAWAAEGFFTGSTQFAKWRGDDLKMRRGNGIYREMILDDQISAAIDLVNAAITGRRWRFKVDDESQQEAADLFTFNLTRSLRGNVTQLVNFMLWARVEGFSVIEKVYGSFSWEGKERWGLANYKLRPNDTITVKTDEHGNVEQLIQERPDGSEANLDPQRFIYSVYKAELDAHYGQSALRGIYEHYWAKLNIYKFWNIFMERMAGGFTVATVEGKLLDGEEKNLRKVMENIQASTNITLPKGVTMEHHMPTDKGTFNEAIKSRNNSISRGLLLPSLVGFSEETSTGSQARSQTQLEVWWMFLDALASWIEDTLNEQLFRELSEWNFGDIDPPLFEFESLTTEQKKLFAEQWMSAVTSKTVKHTVEDEARLRDLLHFGERDPDAELVYEEPSGRNLPGDTTLQDDLSPLPDGSNPLDTAIAGLRSQLTEDKRFEGRVNTTEIEEELYQVGGESFGRELWAAVDDAWLIFINRVRGGDPWELDRVGQLSSLDGTQIEAAIRKNMLSAFEFGRHMAHREINAIRNEQGREPIGLKESTIDTINMSHMAKLELSAAGFALDLETAEEFLEVKLLQLTGNLVNDQILSSTRMAIINGLRTEQSIEEIVANAAEALKPIIGERDSSGNIITEAALPARLATLVRTSLTEAFNEGRRTFFEDDDLDGYVEAYQYSAIIDGRTTEFCRTANGRIWPVDSELWKKYVPPNHFNCRSLMIPVVQGDQWTASRNVPTGVSPSPGF